MSWKPRLSGKRQMYRLVAVNLHNLSHTTIWKTIDRQTSDMTLFSGGAFNNASSVLVFVGTFVLRQYSCLENIKFLFRLSNRLAVPKEKQRKCARKTDSRYRIGRIVAGTANIRHSHKGDSGKAK
ncbi:hypothetical protein CBL_02537 [Carabus blaptoides fortunei]